MINSISQRVTEELQKSEKQINENTNKLIKPIGYEYNNGEFTKIKKPQVKDYAEEIYEEQKLREDTAWQREIADMRKAGINPNLVNLSASGANTGSGTSTIDTAVKGEIDKILQELDQEFKMNENQKNRITLLLTGLLNAGTRLATKK